MRSVVLSSPARIWGALVALMLVCGSATPSRAELNNTLDQGGTLAIVINALDPIGLSLPTPVAATASRDGAGLLTAVGFEAGLFQTTGVVVPVTDPGAFPIAGIQATVSNAAANFVRGGGGLGPAGNIGGTMPLNGVNKVCLFGTCSSAVQNLSVPISVVGLGGDAFVTGAVNLTVRGAPWTQATAAIGASTIMGNAGAATQNTISASSISNVISLVTPIFVSTNIGASAVVPVFGSLNFTLKSVPEPGALAALSAAIVSLAAVGFARRRSS
ncbi:MAG TPA: PEP-CTERM sorting domain-containing protein [Polyangia bacterium]|nr:PEP-CTERM sorting domain-containing protein [Polyangia bacterium]